MRLTKTQLKEAVEAVSPFIQARSTLPILSHVKIESDGSRVTFTASSIDSQIEYWIDAACEKFSACVSLSALKKVAQFCIGDVDRLESQIKRLEEKLLDERLRADEEALEVKHLQERIDELEAAQGEQ